MNNNLQHTKGVTLIEVLVVVFIMSLIATASFMLQNDVFKLNTTLSGNLDAQGDARQTLRQFTADMRTAAPSSNGAYPIAQAATSSVTFYANIDSDTFIERIRYVLATTTLRRGVIKPSGSPLMYQSASEIFTDLVHGVANSTSSIFTYFDENYDGSTSTPPLSEPVPVQSVRLIKIELLIDQSPTQPPGPFLFTTQVTPRNI